MRRTGRTVLALFLAASVGATGCAARRRPGATRDLRATSPAPADAGALAALDTAATLPLDRILPPAVFPASRPATAPSTQPSRPPVEALTLYAEACDNLMAGRRLAAVELLQRALALDPDSFELHYALGRAYRTGGGSDDRSIAEMERAAEIDPDHVDLQADLGRQYVAKGDLDNALWHLRLALKCGDYDSPAREADAAVAELFAGRALARAGYHAAAVEVYERLFARLQRPSFALRGDPETAFLLTRPEMLRLQVAESYEKIGRVDEALKAYDAGLARAPDDLGLRSRAVRALVALRRYDEAAASAADAVARSEADPRAVELLRQACAAAGREGAVVDELRRLRKKRPDDAGVLFALADVLRGQGKAAEAMELLRQAEANPKATVASRSELVKRIYACARDLDATGVSAARFLVDWSARNPDAVHVVSEEWDDLVRPSHVPRLGLRSLRQLEPGAERVRLPKAHAARWQAAKWYWAAQLARLRHRNDLALEALRRAMDAGVVFAPAYRTLLGMELAPNAPEELASRAAGSGDAALAAELRGLGLLTRKEYATARTKLDESAALGGKSPELLLARAVAARGTGDLEAYESLLWKLVSDWPDFDDGYETLYGHYASRGAVQQAARVLSMWLAADRSDVSARLLQVRQAFQGGRPDLAGRALEELVNQRGDDPRVLSSARSYYRQAGGMDGFVRRLRERVAARPGDLAAAALLVDTLAEQGQQAEASRVLDAARKALADDPELLYDVAHLYGRVQQSGMTEQVLRDVLRLDPAHPAASNDLGYSLGDEGRELDEAERLVRKAVEADPANPSFLDSLGWVLYKRGRFGEAREQLSRAVETAAAKGADADPIVLDHLGDATYRAGDPAGAAERWKQAMRGLTADAGAADGAAAAAGPAPSAGRDDPRSLRLQLERKTKQVDAGQPASVAPVGEPRDHAAADAPDPPVGGAAPRVGVSR